MTNLGFRRPHIIAGNWKMNQTLSDLDQFFKKIDASIPAWKCQAWIAPQALHLSECLSLASNTPIKIGAQNCHQEKSGAFTGEISPAALKDLGCHFVIIGHSERRQYFKEDHKLLAQKIKLALEHNLSVIFCVGETLQEREQNQTEMVLQQQLKEALVPIYDQVNGSQNKFLIAYEPVWAIGTGKVATGQQANQAHQFIRQTLSSLKFAGEQIPILYGGSVKPDNIKELLGFKDIDGALVGGASLKPQDFDALCRAASLI